MLLIIARQCCFTECERRKGPKLGPSPRRHKSQLARPPARRAVDEDPLTCPRPQSPNRTSVRLTVPGVALLFQGAVPFFSSHHLKLFVSLPRFRSVAACPLDYLHLSARSRRISELSLPSWSLRLQLSF